MAKRKGKHKPSAKAKKAYYRLIEKGYLKTRATLKKHNPDFLKKHGD
jgi:hypothetical protein